MKKILILLLLFGILGACKNKTNTPPLAPIDQLPPATQEGANTAGCLLNGEPFIAEKRNNIPFSLNYINGEDFALLIGNNSKNRLNDILISIHKTQLEVGKTYALNETFGGNSKTGEYEINTGVPFNSNYYSTNPDITGEVTITAHNFNEAYLSGTFWFDAVNSEGTVVQFREGRFDMDY